LVLHRIEVDRADPDVFGIYHGKLRYHDSTKYTNEQQWVTDDEEREFEIDARESGYLLGYKQKVLCYYDQQSGKWIPFILDRNPYIDLQTSQKTLLQEAGSHTTSGDPNEVNEIKGDANLLSVLFYVEKRSAGGSWAIVNDRRWEIAVHDFLPQTGQVSGTGFVITTVRDLDELRLCAYVRQKADNDNVYVAKAAMQVIGLGQWGFQESLVPSPQYSTPTYGWYSLGKGNMTVDWNGLPIDEVYGVSLDYVGRSVKLQQLK